MFFSNELGLEAPSVVEMFTSTDTGTHLKKLNNKTNK